MHSLRADEIQRTIFDHTSNRTSLLNHVENKFLRGIDAYSPYGVYNDLISLVPFSFEKFQLYADDYRRSTAGRPKNLKLMLFRKSFWRKVLPTLDDFTLLHLAAWSES